jgi:hypothetical protein
MNEARLCLAYDSEEMNMSAMVRLNAAACELCRTEIAECSLGIMFLTCKKVAAVKTSEEMSVW